MDGGLCEFIEGELFGLKEGNILWKGFVGEEILDGGNCPCIDGNEVGKNVGALEEGIEFNGGDVFWAIELLLGEGHFVGWGCWANGFDGGDIRFGDGGK